MSKKLTRRRSLYLGLGALTALATFAGNAELKRQRILALDDPQRDFTAVGGGSLKERAASIGLIYGAAIRHDHLRQDAKLAAAVKSECGMLVPEWALKWSTPKNPLRPNPDSFDFSAADEMLEFAHTHGMLFRGHTLVWHESLPDWFANNVNYQNAKQILEKHINTVVGRYAGKIHSWDVVNEAIEPRDGRSDGLRKTPWLKLLGTDYIDYAFRLAAAADPQAILVYNDYGLDYDTSEDEVKRNAVLKLLESLKLRGTPIHALGIQAHLDAAETAFNPKKLRQFLRNVASLGLKIMITELDITDKKLSVDTTVCDRIIARAYEDYLNAVLSEPAVIAVLTWGLSDKYTWLSEFQPRSDGVPVRPLLLDSDMNRKLSWNAVASAFDKSLNSDFSLVRKKLFK
jgi:endo-1,4-beta-xylanase